MTRPALAAGLLALGALAAVGAVVGPWPVARPDPAGACRALADLEDALDLATVTDQAVIRARAAALADALVTEGFGDGESDRAAAVAGRRIVEVLDQPGSTVADLADVLGPVQRQCASADPGRAS